MWAEREQEKEGERASDNVERERDTLALGDIGLFRWTCLRALVSVLIKLHSPETALNGVLPLRVVSETFSKLGHWSIKLVQN